MARGCPAQRPAPARPPDPTDARPRPRLAGDDYGRARIAAGPAAPPISPAAPAAGGERRAHVPSISERLVAPGTRSTRPASAPFVGAPLAPGDRPAPAARLNPHRPMSDRAEALRGSTGYRSPNRPTGAGGDSAQVQLRQQLDLDRVHVRYRRSGPDLHYRMPMSGSSPPPTGSGAMRRSGPMPSRRSPAPRPGPPAMSARCSRGRGAAAGRGDRRL